MYEGNGGDKGEESAKSRLTLLTSGFDGVLYIRAQAERTFEWAEKRCEIILWFEGIRFGVIICIVLRKVYFLYTSYKNN